MCSANIYVSFTKAKSVIGKVLHDQISHCFCFWQDGEHWIVLDQNIDSTDVSIVKDYRDIIGGITLKVQEKEYKGSLVGFNTCVSSVKRRIGLKAPLILTPYQLYKRLQHGTF